MLHRSLTLRLVVKLFVLLILCSGIHISHPPGVTACVRLSCKIDQVQSEFCTGHTSKSLVMDQTQLHRDKAAAGDQLFNSNTFK